MNENTKYRVYAGYLIILLFAIAVSFKMFKEQMKKGIEESTQISIVRLSNIEAPRGNIYAQNEGKNALALSVPVYEIRFDLVAAGYKVFDSKNEIIDDEYNRFIHKDIDTLAIQLSKLFKIDKSYYKNSLKKAFDNKKRYHLIRKEATYQQLKEIKTFKVLNRGRYKGGLITIEKNKREHPYGQLALRTIGYYNESDTIVGLEGYFNQYLCGANGKQYTKKITGGSEIPLSEDYIKKPVKGADIYTSIDINIQDVAENALREQLINQNAKMGCVVLMEVETGYIKAISNLSKNSDGSFSESYNHAVGRSTQPGSTFKLPAILAALDDEKIKAEDIVDSKDGKIKYYDRVITDSRPGGYGKIPVWQGFAYSSNVVISQIINDAYKKNPEQFIKKLRSFGLENKTGITINGEGNPWISSPDYEKWSGVSLPSIAIGYETRFTPIQILSFYNAIANNGKYMQPQLITEIKRGSNTIKEFEPKVLNKKICKDKTIKTAKFMLEKVVEEGTGKNLNNKIYKIAGKTGTARIAKGELGYGTPGNIKYQSSFCGYFPADNPKYSCIVVIYEPENAYYGAVVSGTVFKNIADKVYASYFDLNTTNQEIDNLAQMPYSKGGSKSDLETVSNELNIPFKSNNSTKLFTKTISKPSQIESSNYNVESNLNVVGLGLKDAIYLLETNGYSVKVTGSGTIKKQEIINADKKIIKLILA